MLRVNQLIGFGKKRAVASSPGVWGLISHNNLVSPSNTGAPSFSGIDIGPAGTNKFILVSLSWTSFGSGVHSITSMSLTPSGGSAIAGTRVVRALAGNADYNCEQWLFNVGSQAGTTATLAWVKGGGVANPYWAGQAVVLRHDGVVGGPTMTDSKVQWASTSAATVTTVNASPGHLLAQFGQNLWTGTPVFNGSPVDVPETYVLENATTADQTRLESVFGHLPDAAATTITMSEFNSSGQFLIASVWTP